MELMVAIEEVTVAVTGGYHSLNSRVLKKIRLNQNENDENIVMRNNKNINIIK